MKPFYFGDRDRSVYGVYDPPMHIAGAAEGAVLCYPLGNEYMKSHRAFRHLAKEIAKVGVHVLRFDYSGTGDSWGSGDDASIPRWVEDIQLAIAELRDMSQTARVSLVGFRFGASLATLVASRHHEVDRLVLWDPVLDGRRYAETLVESIGGAGGFHKLPDRSCAVLSANGFDLSERLVQQMTEIDLTALELDAVRIDVISNSTEVTHAEWVALLRARNVEAHLHQVQGEGWGSGGDFSSAVLNPEVTREIVASFAKTRGA